MKITSIDIKPIETFSYKNVKSGKDWNNDRSNFISENQLPILKGSFEGTGTEIQALICASDLQGNVDEESDQILLGEKLADFLKLLIEVEFNIAPDNVGVLLAGDLYANPEKRGGYGDVRQVYLNFRDCFKWVVGVMGNHDQLGNNKQEELKFRKEPFIQILHKHVIWIDNFRIGGISGIIGGNRKPNRVEESEYFCALNVILKQQHDILLLHETPDIPADGFQGNEKIRVALETSQGSLVVCGHKFWSEPLRTLRNGTQVLNVNERVVILIRSVPDRQMD